jgi:hypothetical protein
VSPQDSNSRPLLSRIDIYTVMLAVAFLSIVLGCVLLSLELGRYNWNIKAKGVGQAASTSALAASLVCPATV